MISGQKRSGAFVLAVEPRRDCAILELENRTLYRLTGSTPRLLNGCEKDGGVTITADCVTLSEAAKFATESHHRDLVQLSRFHWEIRPYRTYSLYDFSSHPIWPFMLLVNASQP